VSAAQTENLWVPVCCERVMRYNMFVQQNGTAYGALVCSVCNKNVTFELEHEAEMSKYGQGSRVLNVLGSPKPPNAPRKAGGDAGQDDDKTL
jgi:hypothetical protein